MLAGFDEADLAALFIVSKVTVTKRDGEPADLDADATVSVKLSDAPKCPRCWNHDVFQRAASASSRARAGS